MKKKTKKAFKDIHGKFLEALIEKNDEVSIVREIARLSKSTVRIPVPYNIDKTNYYKV